MIRGKEENRYIIIKGLILKNNNFNVYALNNKVSRYVMQKLVELQGEIDKFTTMVGDFNAPLLGKKSLRTYVNRTAPLIY